MEKEVCKEREGWICSWDRISLKVTRYQGHAHKQANSSCNDFALYGKFKLQDL
jgi:hypothetical protein